jgi:hypothetical protein
VSDDPRRRFSKALNRDLRCGRLRRRRLVRELSAHLDDTVAELEARGMPEPVAVEEALRRLGDTSTIAAALREQRPERRRAIRLRSPAWVAVGAMSLVTAWAAELPQASGARPTTPGLSAAHARHLRSPSAGEHRRVAARRSSARARHVGRR